MPIDTALACQRGLATHREGGAQTSCSAPSSEEDSRRAAQGEIYIFTKHTGVLHYTSHTGDFNIIALAVLDRAYGSSAPPDGIARAWDVLIHCEGLAMFKSEVMVQGGVDPMTIKGLTNDKLFKNMRVIEMAKIVFQKT